MTTIMTILPLMFLFGIFAIAAFIIVAVVKVPNNPDLRDTSTGERILLTLLGFFIPLIGIVLFFVWRKNRPELARPIAYGLKVYLIITVALYIIGFLAYGIDAMITDS